jgi:hypothetical protein
VEEYTQRVELAWANLRPLVERSGHTARDLAAVREELAAIDAGLMLPFSAPAGQQTSAFIAWLPAPWVQGKCQGWCPGSAGASRAILAPSLAGSGAASRTPGRRAQ